MKAIEDMQPQINDMERRLGIMQSVEPVLESAIKTLQKLSMSAAWARSDSPDSRLCYGSTLSSIVTIRRLTDNLSLAIGRMKLLAAS